MELSLIMATALVALVFSGVALVLSAYNFIDLQAGKRSTHSVIPVSSNSSMAHLEKELEKITKGAGMGQGDLNRDLYDAGMSDVEDLI